VRLNEYSFLVEGDVRMVGRTVFFSFFPPLSFERFPSCISHLKYIGGIWRGKVFCFHKIAPIYCSPPLGDFFSPLSPMKFDWSG